MSVSLYVYVTCYVCVLYLCFVAFLPVNHCSVPSSLCRVCWFPCTRVGVFAMYARIGLTCVPAEGEHEQRCGVSRALLFRIEQAQRRATHTKPCHRRVSDAVTHKQWHTFYGMSVCSAVCALS